MTSKSSAPPARSDYFLLEDILTRCEVTPTQLAQWVRDGDFPKATRFGNRKAWLVATVIAFEENLSRRVRELGPGPYGVAA